MGGGCRGAGAAGISFDDSTSSIGRFLSGALGTRTSARTGGGVVVFMVVFMVAFMVVFVVAVLARWCVFVFLRWYYMTAIIARVVASHDGNIYTSLQISKSQNTT
jgi:hypothetical protein